jgi:hypothetical protein
MKRRTSLTFAVALLASGCGIDTSESMPRERTAMPTEQDFRERIDHVAARLVDLTSPDDLFAQPDFLLLYENPTPYLAWTLTLWVNPEVPPLKKTIAAYAMQRLPIGDFVALVSALADLVAQGRAPVRLLERLAFAPPNWGAALVVNHQDPRVEPLLRRLASFEAFNASRREYIAREVMTGEAKKQIDVMRETGQIR